MAVAEAAGVEIDKTAAAAEAVAAEAGTVEAERHLRPLTVSECLTLTRRKEEKKGKKRKKIIFDQESNMAVIRPTNASLMLLSYL